MIRDTFVPLESLLLPALGAALLMTAAGHRVQTPSTDRYNPLRAAYMRAHFHQALLVHDAVARGDLPEAKRQAAVLAEHSPTVPMPVGADAFQGALTKAARDAAGANSLDQAAQGIAEVLGTCGQCHKAMNVRASVPASPDERVGGVVGHMLLHQRGADALLEGLVAPSESQWVEGVRAFAAPRVARNEVPGRMRRSFDHGETELASLAGHMAQAHRTRDRESLYGKVIATCGSCHQQLAPRGGPRRGEQ